MVVYFSLLLKVYCSDPLTSVRRYKYKFTVKTHCVAVFYFVNIEGRSRKTFKKNGSLVARLLVG